MPPGSFAASQGWLYRFLRRKNIRHIKLTGETRSGDEVAAQRFPELLRKLIEEKGYHPDCIYNMDETGLQFKKMPRSTFLAKSVKQARGRKIDKSRITVMFCVNQTGTHKMKPLVVHTARHPRCYKNLKDMSSAPVYWRTSRKAWVTSGIMHDWLLNCFVRDAKRKCQASGHEFKVLLLMDNCPAHKPYLETLHPSVEVLFLPPNTTSIIQPLDQEIISCVKAKYHELVFRQLRDATETNVELRMIQDENMDDVSEEDDDELPDLPLPDPDMPDMPARKTVAQFWKSFTVKDAVDNLMVAWKGINEVTVQHGWKKLTPHLYSQDEPPTQTLATSMADALAVAREVPGFGDVSAEEISELHVDAATTQDIMEAITVEDNLQEEQEVQGREEEDQDAPGTLTMMRISGILAAAEVFKESVVECEVCPVRSSEMVQGLGKLIRFYSEMHSKRMLERKQSLITRFLKKTRESESEMDDSSVFDDESVVGDLDFDGFMAELAQAQGNGGASGGGANGGGGDAGPSTSGGSGSQ